MLYYRLIVFIHLFSTDSLIPIQDNQSTSLILCVLGCLKVILPHIKNGGNEQEINGSFGRRKEINEVPVAVDKLLQVSFFRFCTR